MLDGALTLLRHGVRPDARLDRATLDTLHRTLDAYLRTVGGPSIDPDNDALPAPDLGPLRDAGIPTVDDESFAAAMAGDGDRRRLLAGLLVHDGWTVGAWDRRRRSLLS